MFRRASQLHGDGARRSLFDLPASGLKTIYVLHAHPDGRIETMLPVALAESIQKQPRVVDWVVVDSLKVTSFSSLSHTVNHCHHYCTW